NSDDVVRVYPGHRPLVDCDRGWSRIPADYWDRGHWRNARCDNHRRLPYSSHILCRGALCSISARGKRRPRGCGYEPEPSMSSDTQPTATLSRTLAGTLSQTDFGIRSVRSRFGTKFETKFWTKFAVTFLLPASLSFLAGCAVGPNYKRPAID